MDICDVFDSSGWKKLRRLRCGKAGPEPRNRGKQLARLEKGRPESDILDVVEKQHALPLYSEGRLAGCCRRAHDTDENLEAGIMLENLSCKASGVLALLHLIKNAGLSPSDIDFVVECSEEAMGDASSAAAATWPKHCRNSRMRQRQRFDVRGFCAGPASVITSMVLRCARQRGRSWRPSLLYMNARDRVKKDVKV
ncbi:MAG: hypothetical protein ACLSAH_11550 [Bilophila wadsworthia]